MPTIPERCDRMVKRIDNSLDEDSQILSGLARRLRDSEYLKHEDALSVPVLNTLAVERLRRLKEDITS